MASRSSDVGLADRSRNSTAAATAPEGLSASPASQLSAQELEELREVFDLARTDRHSDSLTISDLRTLMNDLHLKPTEAELEAIFEDARDPGEGGPLNTASGVPSSVVRTISFEQFANLMARRVQSDYTPSQLRNAFQLFETGDNGYVQSEVLVHALCTYGSETMSRAEAQRLVDMVDPHHTGKIDYVEFVDTVTGQKDATLMH